MAFSNPIVAGTTLIREAINSPNYVPGDTGWTINRDGTSEFGEAVIRGLLKVAATVGDAYLTIFASGDSVFVDIQPGSTGLSEPVFQGNIYTAHDTGLDEAYVIYASPSFAGQPQAQIVFGASTAIQTFIRIIAQSLFDVTADLINLNGPVTVTDTLTATGKITASGDFQVSGSNSQFNNDVQINGVLDDSNGFKYYKGQRGTNSTATGGAGAVASATINFATAFPVGVVPDVHVNVTNTAATQNQWEGHAISVTNTGFQILYHGPVTAGFNVNSYWNAFSPV